MRTGINWTDGTFDAVERSAMRIHDARTPGFEEKLTPTADLRGGKSASTGVRESAMGEVGWGLCLGWGGGWGPWLIPGCRRWRFRCGGTRFVAGVGC